jgi:hypothetical protein
LYLAEELACVLKIRLLVRGWTCPLSSIWQCLNLHPACCKASKLSRKEFFGRMQALPDTKEEIEGRIQQVEARLQPLEALKHKIDLEAKRLISNFAVCRAAQFILTLFSTLRA